LFGIKLRNNCKYDGDILGYKATINEQRQYTVLLSRL